MLLIPGANSKLLNGKGAPYFPKLWLLVFKNKELLSLFTGNKELLVP